MQAIVEHSSKEHPSLKRSQGGTRSGLVWTLSSEEGRRASLSKSGTGQVWHGKEELQEHYFIQEGSGDFQTLLGMDTVSLQGK